MSRLETEELLRTMTELRRRQADDPLLIFKPHAKQKAFIDSVLQRKSLENWMLAGNRCITPWTPIETAVGERRIVELLGETAFDVRSWDGDSLCTNRASNVHLKSIEPAFCLYLDNGQAFQATGKHRVLTPVGWASIEKLLSMPNDRHCLEIASDCLASYAKGDHRYDLSSPFETDNDQGELPPIDDVRLLCQTDCGNLDAAEHTPAHIHTCPALSPLSTLCDPSQLSDLFSLWTDQGCEVFGLSSYHVLQDVLQSQPESVLRQSTELSREAPTVQACDIILLGGVKLIGYQKIGWLPIVDFEVERSHCYRACGVIHHNSGKSDAGAFVGATLARFGLPGSPGPTSGWVSALDFSTSRDVIQPKYFDNGFVPPGQSHAPFIPPHEIASWRVDDQILRLKNGSVVGFKSADSGRRKYQGSERDWFHMDEEHPWEIYEEAVIRVGARPLLFFCTATILPPEGIAAGSSWVFGKIIQPWQDGTLKHVAVFGASIYDNPGIPLEEIKRLEAIYPENSLSRRIRMAGEWLPGISGSRAYTAFQRQLHVREAPPISPRMPLIWTWDFNVEPMCSLVGQMQLDTYWVHHEFVLDEASVPEMCQTFRDRFPKHGAEIWLYGDATSNRRTGQTGKTDYFVILQEMKTYNVPIRMRVPNENPRIPDRINAVNRLLLDENGQVRLRVDPSCQHLIRDLEGVLRDKRGGIHKTHNRKDPYFKLTHTSDSLGYWISFEEPVRPPSDRRTGSTVRNPNYGFTK